MKLSKYGPNVRAEGKITLQGVGVGWDGVGGGRVTILTKCNSRCFLTFLILLLFCILLFFETIKEKLIFDYLNLHIEFSYYIDKTKGLIPKFKFLGQPLNEEMS